MYDKVKEVMQAVIDGLTPLANKLGVAVDHLFVWAVKHNYAIAIQELAVIPFWIASICCLIYYSKRANWDDGHGNFNGHAAMTIVFGVATLGFTIATVVCVMSAIPRLVAPEYSTVQDIVHLIQGDNNSR